MIIIYYLYFLKNLILDWGNYNPKYGYGEITRDVV